MADIERLGRLQQKKVELQQEVLKYLTPDQLKIVRQVEGLYKVQKGKNAPYHIGTHKPSMFEAISRTPGAEEVYQEMKEISGSLYLSPEYIELTYPVDPDDEVTS